MKHFYLIANPLKPRTGPMQDEIVRYLREHGASCSCLDELKTDPKKIPLSSLVPEETECVITLGGDGTILRAARNLTPRRIPLLGINLGNMGYLTQVSGNEELAPALNALLEDNFRLESRMMLEGTVTAETAGQAGKVLQTGVALNEIVLARNGGLQPIRFTVTVNGQYLNEYTADGMIVATPTGSTAYNLSAGGPVVTPCAQLMLLTPVCPHALSSRSIILSGEDQVEIRVRDDAPGRSHMAVFDGDLAADLDASKALRISRSSCEAAFIRLRDVSFLDCLSSKMAKL